MTKRKKIFITLSSVAIIFLISAGAYLYLEAKTTYEKFMGIEDLKDREENFLKNPTAGECVILVDRFGFALKDYDKAIKYGEQCLTLDRPSELLDWLINYWLADLYNKTGDFNKAKSHLTAALKLDTENRIENSKWIEKSDLQKVYAQIPGEIKRLHDEKP
jgi:tetratricopeptide (TPR) repeat protein